RRLLSRVSTIRAALRLSRLHAHPRGPLCGEACGGAPANRRPALHELSRLVQRRLGLDEGLSALTPNPLPRSGEGLSRQTLSFSFHPASSRPFSSRPSSHPASSRLSSCRPFSCRLFSGLFWRPASCPFLGRASSRASFLPWAFQDRGRGRYRP